MKKLFSWLLVSLPVLWIFKNIFSGHLPSWGDAPFFYAEGLKELFSEPLTWTQRGISFGGVNQLLWLSPTMFLMGALHRFLSLDSNCLIRIVFYFHSIILAFLGPYFLTRYLKLSRITQFFSVFIYLLNTYYLLLVDGGQVGVALAYGIFPFVILFGKKVLDKLRPNLFFLFLIISFILTAVDPRVCVVALITLFVWQLLENWRKLWILVLASVLLLFINLYWIYPLIKIKVATFGLDVAGLQLSSVLNSLLLFAPHWPNNIFGKVAQPPFYFALVPFLLFGNLLFKQENQFVKHLSLSFLLLAFIVKGSTPPLGGWYDLLVNRLPFGFAFRDSSKFFIPLVLFGGILIGETANRLQSKSKIFSVLIYFYLLLSINPAILGKLNFNLSNRTATGDYQTIYENLKKDNTSFRTLWFPEVPPLAFGTESIGAISARDLVKETPFSSLNASEDVFNFLNNPQYVKWLQTLGVKYLFLSGDSRNINPIGEDIKNWNTIESLVAKTPGLKKLNWGTNLSIHEVPGTLPKSFVVGKLVAVVGSKIESGGKLPVPSLYFEDGKWDPALLREKNKDSFKILFNEKEKLDLTMSFLQKYFVSTQESNFFQWSTFGVDEYLKYKYELLIRGFKFEDFDYGKGIAFSTNKGEEMKFKFKVSQAGNYLLAKRSGSLEKQNFSWTIEEKNLKKGSFEYQVINNSGFEVLNVVALIPKDEFNKADSQAETYLKNSGIVTEKEINNFDWHEVGLKKVGTLKYNFATPQKGFWVILTDSYHSLWRLQRGADYFESVPVYSMVNGFYFDPKWGNLGVEFKGQDYFRWGVWLTSVSALGLLLCWIYFSKSET